MKIVALLLAIFVLAASVMALKDRKFCFLRKITVLPKNLYRSHRSKISIVFFQLSVVKLLVSWEDVELLIVAILILLKITNVCYSSMEVAVVPSTNSAQWKNAKQHVKNKY